MSLVNQMLKDIDKRHAASAATPAANHDLQGVMRSEFPWRGVLLGGGLVAAFAVVVLGGLGSVWGAYIGGLIVGVVEAFAGYYIDPALKSAIWFLIFLVVLIVRPAGLMGQVGAEEVGFREQN